MRRRCCMLAPVLKAPGLTKRFTEGGSSEVLHGVDLQVYARRDAWRSSAPRVRARARCCTCWAGWTRRPRARCSCMGQDFAHSMPRRRAAAQPAPRLRLPVPSPAAGIQRAGQRGHAAAHPPRNAGAVRAAGRRDAGARWACRKRVHASAGRAVGRRAPARGDRARAGHAPGLRDGRRAHRQPRPHHRRRACST